MLHRDEDRPITIMNHRAAGFGLVRHGEELHQMTSLVALERHPEQPVGLGNEPGAPSVATQRFPTESNARLSGHEIMTGPFQPPK